MDINKIDENLVLKRVTETDIVWHNPNNAPFSVHGVFYENDEYIRLPRKIAKTISNGVHYLSGFTAGGRIRFVTNSKHIALRVVAPKSFDIMLHMPIAGEYGFSVYVDGKFLSFIAPDQFDIIDKNPIVYDGIIKLDEKTHEIEIYFPLYYTISEVLIGLSSNAIIEKHPPYKHSAPIVFYGSSITQGGCASHAGNDYISILSRWLNSDIINLGFSGSAKGEQEMADYLATLCASIFVIDYDNNAPTVEHLKNTHFKLYETIRKKHALTPIVMISRPNTDTTKDFKARREVIKNTIKRAIDLGDKNVYFIDGETLFGKKDRDACTVDGCHPNDLGFYRMAETIYPMLKNILEEN